MWSWNFNFCIKVNFKIEVFESDNSHGFNK
jgi:hypothetical protein